jgi:hypothetical protein
MATHDDKRREELGAIIEALGALTSLALIISRQVNELKFIVFRKTLTQDEYESTDATQQEVFKKADDVIEKLKNVTDTLRHG